MADPPRKRMSAVQRRGELLDAASEVFGRRGYHGASLDEIASTAGVSKALIYEHFTSKRELHAELVEQHAGEIFRRLQANTEAGTTGEERLRGGIEAFLGVRRGEPRRLAGAVPGRLGPRGHRGDLTCTRAGGGRRRCADGRRHPREPGVSAKQRAQFFEMQGQLLAGAIQVLAHWWTDHPSIPRETVVDRAMDFCWIGLDRVSQGELFRRGKLVR